jgi:hypothetical protein
MRITKFINTYTINIVQNVYKVNDKFFNVIIEKTTKKTRESLNREPTNPA